MSGIQQLHRCQVSNSLHCCGKGLWGNRVDEGVADGESGMGCYPPDLCIFQLLGMKWGFQECPKDQSRRGMGVRN